jgi:nucleoside-diphosphate-sugar epimerase
VYGPFSEPFTRRPARHLLAGLPVLVGDGSQPSNTIYVDNVVGAILSALRVPGIDGQTFVLADEEPLTWRQLFEAYAAALGVRPVSVSVDEYEAMLAASRAPRRQPWLRRWADAALDIATSHEAMGLAKKILATDPIGTFPRRLINRSPRFKEALRRLVGDNQPEIYRVERTPGGPGVPLQLLQVYAITAGVNISKARSRLGYESLMDRGRALSTTSDWLQDAFRCAHGARSVVVNA